MAEIVFNCSRCETQLEIDASFSGQDVACPTCGHVMTVPRRRGQLSVKGRPPVAVGSESAAASSSVADNLSELANVDAFSGDREKFIERRRRWAMVRQVAVLLGLLASLLGVGYGAWCFYDAREERKREHAARQQIEIEAGRKLRLLEQDARRLGREAARKSSYWRMSDGDNVRLLAALVALHGDSVSHKKFEEWVELDVALHGVVGESLAAVTTPAAVESCCQRVVGMALGLGGTGAALPPQAELRRLALLMLKFRENSELFNLFRPVEGVQHEF